MTTTLTEKTLVALVALGILIFLFLDWATAFVLLGIAGIMLPLSAKQIKPASPPQVAVPTLWGRRQKKIIKARWVFVFPYFPLVEDVILIDVEKQEQEVTIPNVRCRAEESTSPAGATTPARPATPRSGGSVTVEAGVTFEPSTEPPEQILDYIDAGQKAGVLRILQNVLEGAVREEGGNNTWQSLSFAKAALSAKVIALVTGVQPQHRVVRSPAGIPMRDVSSNYRAYQVVPIAPGDVLDEIDYQAFLQQVLVNGYNDVLGLGIRVRRLNVTKVTPEGELRGDAERLAREEQQRLAENMDFETERALIKAYMDEANAGLPNDDPNRVTYREAASWVRINRGRAQEVNAGGGRGGNLASAAAVVRTPPVRQPPQGGTNA